MADQVTPLQMAQQARKRSKKERLGDYYEAVTDVEEITATSRNSRGAPRQMPHCSLCPRFWQSRRRNGDDAD